MGYASLAPTLTIFPWTSSSPPGLGEPGPFRVPALVTWLEWG